MESQLEKTVGQLLAARHETIATAESCTGGLLASRLTDISGSSAYVQGAVVAYAQSVKRGLLGLPEAGVLDQGIVSEAVAVALAEAARLVIGADWGVGTTGWAGNGEGVPPDEAGMVWIGVAGPSGKTASRCERLGGETPREDFKRQATDAALVLLQRELQGA